MINSVKLERFTAFDQLSLQASPGMNVLIGENGTGKTHLLKALYAACDITRTKEAYAEKLLRVFLPHNRQLGRLVHRQMGSSTATIIIRGRPGELRVSFSNHAEQATSAKTAGARRWTARRVECAYLPVKEMLAHAPGFRALYSARDIHFEETYADVIDRALRPILKGPTDAPRRDLLRRVQGAIDGKVTAREQEFFLRNREGNLEFTLLAEGIRKLALLWLLIQNGTLLKGSVLFWDEPEANLNPKLVRHVMEILLALQRTGVQVFVATHDYVVLKELDLLTTPSDDVVYHALWRDGSRQVRLNSTSDYVAIHPNAIADTFAGLYDRDVKRARQAGDSG